jgi:4-amino-4-deoxy-L-arabinose transferase-like glycosyltransferase
VIKKAGLALLEAASRGSLVRRAAVGLLVLAFGVIALVLVFIAAVLTAAMIVGLTLMWQVLGGSPADLTFYVTARSGLQAIFEALVRVFLAQLETGHPGSGNRRRARGGRTRRRRRRRRRRGRTAVGSR